MTDVIITKLSFEDIPGLKNVYDNAFEGSVSDTNQMKGRFQKIKDNPEYLILVAKIETEIVGSVMGVVCYELFGSSLPFMVVENVAVLSEYRRMGVAKKLMQELEEQAKRNNCTTILFVSSAHRAGAHKLYESLGYGMDKVNGYRKRLK
jgi:predicted N-acetyltransferase YhbS